MLITKYPIAVFEMLIKALPTNDINLPIPLVIKKEPECLRASKNAVSADEQKFFPLIAT